MTPEDFNQWREDYDQMTYTDQVEFYNQVEREHPNQRFFYADSFAQLLGAACATLFSFSVIELGGWKGELAEKMLLSYPPISYWINYEISQRAVQKSPLRSPRYFPIVLPNFLWTSALWPADVFISSHTIEHIREKQLKRLFSKLPKSIKFIGLQSPLPEGPTDWTDDHGSHILECGWGKVKVMLEKRGFELFMEEGEFRGFRRIKK